jgi:hypothetical protein
LAENVICKEKQAATSQTEQKNKCSKIAPPLIVDGIPDCAYIIHNKTPHLDNGRYEYAEDQGTSWAIKRLDGKSELGEPNCAVHWARLTRCGQV